MAIEIERKFLVKSDDFIRMAKTAHRITQGYICAESGKTVRIRIKDEKGYITIKGKSTDDGLSRFEWEKEIPLDEARQLMTLCGEALIDKTRYIVPFGRHTFEVDVFYGANKGLTLAEVELTKPDETFEIPSFLGEEVTGNRQYYNSELMKSPYNTWG